MIGEENQALPYFFTNLKNLLIGILIGKNFLVYVKIILKYRRKNWFQLLANIGCFDAPEDVGKKET